MFLIFFQTYYFCKNVADSKIKDSCGDIDVWLGLCNLPEAALSWAHLIFNFVYFNSICIRNFLSVFFRRAGKGRYEQNLRMKERS